MSLGAVSLCLVILVGSGHRSQPKVTPTSAVSPNHVLPAPAPAPPKPTPSPVGSPNHLLPAHPEDAEILRDIEFFSLFRLLRDLDLFQKAP